MPYHNGSNGSNRSMRSMRRSGGTPPVRAMQRGRTTGRARTRSSSSNLNNTNDLMRGTRFTGNPVRRYTSPNGINRFGGNRTNNKAQGRRNTINRNKMGQTKKNIPNSYNWIGKLNQTTGQIDNYYCPPGTRYLDKECKKHTGKELNMVINTNYLSDRIRNKRIK